MHHIPGLKHVIALVAMFALCTHSAAAADSQECIVAFVVSTGGKLVSAQIATPSSSSSFDTDALTAIREAAPFGPLPKGADEKTEFKARFVKTGDDLEVTILPDTGGRRFADIEALAGGKPIVDLQGIRREILMHWFPPKCLPGGKMPIVTFHVDQSGKATNIQLEHSAFTSLHDKACLQAVTEAQFPAFPFEPDFRCDFGGSFLPGRSYGTVTVINTRLPVSFVSSDHQLYKKARLNNLGVAHMMKNELAAAEEDLQSALSSGGDYAPAKHNSALLRRLRESKTAPPPAATAHPATF